MGTVPSRRYCASCVRLSSTGGIGSSREAIRLRAWLPPMLKTQLKTFTGHSSSKIPKGSPMHSYVGWGWDSFPCREPGMQGAVPAAVTRGGLASAWGRGSPVTAAGMLRNAVPMMQEAGATTGHAGKASRGQWGRSRLLRWGGHASARAHSRGAGGRAWECCSSPTAPSAGYSHGRSPCPSTPERSSQALPSGRWLGWQDSPHALTAPLQFSVFISLGTGFPLFLPFPNWPLIPVSWTCLPVRLCAGNNLQLGHS